MQINKISSTVLNKPNFKNTGTKKTSTLPEASNTSALPYFAPRFSEYAKSVIETKNQDYDLCYDFNNLKTIALPNNLEVVFDVSPVNKNTQIELALLPDKYLNTNSSVQVLLADILSQDPDEESEKYYENGMRKECYFSYDILLLLNCMYGEITCSDLDIKTGLNKMLDYLLNPDLTQEKLNKAKESAMENSSDYDTADSKAMCNLYYKEKNGTSIDSYNKITLNEVKNLHKTLIENSMGKIVISLSNEQYLKNKDEILNTLSSKVPNLKPYKSVEDYRTIGPVEKDARYESKGKDKVSVKKYYTPTDNGTLKDEIILYFIDKAIDKAAEDIPHNSNIADIESDFSENTKNKFIYFYSKSSEGILKGKQPSTKEIEDYINKVIEEVKNKPLDNKTFDTIKNKIKKERIERYKSEYLRHDLLFNSYTKGTNSMKDFIKTLDTITPEDIQRAAKKYFSAPCITALEE